ncbi:MAG: hypothetical protein AAB573_01750 [Patescibacteria group bacterium]
MNEAAKRGSLPYYVSHDRTIRPGDYIAGELATTDGCETIFSGHVRSMVSWVDGTYIHLTDQIIRIPSRSSSFLSLHLHERRGQTAEE